MSSIYSHVASTKKNLLVRSCAKERQCVWLIRNYLFHSVYPRFGFLTLTEEPG